MARCFLTTVNEKLRTGISVMNRMPGIESCFIRRFPSFGSVESHVDFGGTFSVGFCHDRVYDMKLMMKQTLFNVLFLSLLAAHMWWAVCRMGEKRSPSGDNTSAGQIPAVRPAYWRSSNDFQSLWLAVLKPTHDT
jgi:hypothetical protein